jgi:hypothetical protein
MSQLAEDLQPLEDKLRQGASLRAFTRTLHGQKTPNCDLA